MPGDGRVRFVSVVIPTRNDRPFIRDCLDSLRAQDMPIDELIVLDRGSTDGTADVARASGAVTIVMPDQTPGDVARGDTICVAEPRARYRPDAVRTCIDGQGRDHAATPWVGATNFGRAAAAVQRWLPAGPPLLQAWTIDDDKTIRTGAGGWRFAPGAPRALARHCWQARPGWGPPALALAAAGGALLARGWARAAVPVVHAALCTAVAVRAGRQPGVTAHRSFVALEVGHWSAAAGAWRR